MSQPIMSMSLADIHRNKPIIASTHQRVEIGGRFYWLDAVRADNGRMMKVWIAREGEIFQTNLPSETLFDVFADKLEGEAA